VSGSFSSSEGSWLSRVLGPKPHPDSFVCGMRVLEGTVVNEKQRWQYRRSGVDQLIQDGVVTLHHGTGRTVRLRIDDGDWTGAAPRSGFVPVPAVDVDGGARVLLAIPAVELTRFGIDAL
jgi:hypothetical protein